MTPENAAKLSVVLILVVRLGLGIAYSALNPLGEAPDEADHYAYVVYIGREGHLPVGSTVTQGKHPPLYYLAAAAVTRWTSLDLSFLRSNPDVGWTASAAAPNAFLHTTLEAWPWQGGALTMHLARLVSVLSGLALTVGTYALGRALWPWRPFVASAAAAFVAFLPEGLFVGGSVSNDVPAAALAAWALWAAVRGRRNRDAVLAGLIMGLAFLTKVSTVALWPVILLALLLPPTNSYRENREADAYARRSGSTPALTPERGTGASVGAATHNWSEPGRGLGRAALAGSVALLIAAPWLGRNWRLYGDPLGTPVVLATIDRRLVPLADSDLLWLARGWFFSFWGRFGAVGHLAPPWPLDALWVALLFAAAAGWVFAFLSPVLKTGRGQRGERGQTRKISTVARITILFGAPLAVILAMISYSQIALGTDQGRLLFPALAPIALLLAGGWAAWLPDHSATRMPWLVGALALLMTGVAVSALYTGIVQPFAPPATPTPTELATARPVSQRFGDALELTALQWRDTGQGEMELTLYWQVRQLVAQDLRPTLRLVDRSGEPIWEWKRSPGAGRFSTDRWPPGRVVADRYRLPSAVLAQAERVELGVRPFPEAAWLPIVAQLDGGPLLLLPKP